jgi:hypothetical protein
LGWQDGEAGEAEAGSAGEQPAEEYPAGTHCVAGREVCKDFASGRFPRTT